MQEVRHKVSSYENIKSFYYLSIGGINSMTLVVSQNSNQPRVIHFSFKAIAINDLIVAVTFVHTTCVACSALVTIFA